MRLLASVLLAASFLAGCVYKIDIQQGNYVAQDVADKLKVGMTKADVRALLGTPLLTDAFHNNRWDYFFSSVKNGKAENRTRLTIFFENDKVASFVGEARAPLPAPVGGATPPQPSVK